MIKAISSFCVLFKCTRLKISYPIICFYPFITMRSCVLNPFKNEQFFKRVNVKKCIRFSPKRTRQQARICLNFGQILQRQEIQLQTQLPNNGQSNFYQKLFLLHVLRLIWPDDFLVSFEANGSAAKIGLTLKSNQP